MAPRLSKALTTRRHDCRSTNRMARPKRGKQIDAGGPIRFGLAVADAPGGSVNSH
jgi:hypothetical protein